MKNFLDWADTLWGVVVYNGKVLFEVRNIDFIFWPAALIAVLIFLVWCWKTK